MSSPSPPEASPPPQQQQPQRRRSRGKRARATAGGALEEFLLGGFATAAACLVSNPFDTVKTRMQLQGELKGKGTYELHYRNLVHAAWTIARTEGVLALQKGLGPALVYQFVMNGVRLGTYQTLVNAGFTQPRGEAVAVAGGGRSSDFARSVVAGAVGGGLGGVVASPLYLVGEFGGRGIGMLLLV
jgi:solute carrier family 25, member 34/35